MREIFALWILFLGAFLLPLPEGNHSGGVCADTIDYAKVSWNFELKKSYVENFFQEKWKPSLYYSVFSDINLSEFSARVLGELPRSLRPRAKKVLPLIYEVAHNFHLDPFWLAAIAWTESHFRIDATSVVGAKGTMQVMPQTQTYLWKTFRLASLYQEFTAQSIFHGEKSLESLRKNIFVAGYYLHHLLVSFNYNTKYATVAYNMGPSWTFKRLLRKKKVGHKNLYFDKVHRNFKLVTHFYRHALYTSSTF